VALAERHGIDTGPVEARPGARALIDAHLTSERGNIIISLDPGERAFGVLFGGRGHEWARGKTSDLREAAHAAQAWRAGLTLRELAWRYPFMNYTGLAQAYEDGTDIEYRWQWLLDDPDLGPYWPLLRALHADRTLGSLAPSVSHRNFVRLELGPRARSYAEIHVIQLRDEFQVEASWDMNPRTASTVEEAVALAAALVAEHPDAPPADRPGDG
jgi:hypothetical protein